MRFHEFLSQMREAELKITKVAGNKATAGDGVEIDLDQVNLEVDPASKKVSVKPKGTVGSVNARSLIKPGSTINIGD